MVSIVKYLPLNVRAKCLMHLTFTLPPNKITPTKALSHRSFFKNALKDIQILHQNHDFVATLTPKMMSCTIISPYSAKHGGVKVKQNKNT